MFRTELLHVEADFPSGIAWPTISLAIQDCQVLMPNDLVITETT